MQKFTSVFTEVADNLPATKVASEKGTRIKAESDLIFTTAKAYVGTSGNPTTFVVPVPSLNKVDNVIVYSLVASNGDYMDKEIIKESATTSEVGGDGYVLLSMTTTGTLPEGSTIKFNVKGSN